MPINCKKQTLPTIEKEQIDLLARLSNASGVSGDEAEVRKIIREEITPFADSVETDVMGNLIAQKNAKGKCALHVLIAAHMDEVGFMLVDKDSEGIYRFSLIGGIDERSLAGKQVLIGKDHLPGVIGACPVHLSTKEERECILKLESLRIDAGPGCTDLQLGSYAVFATRFQAFGPSLIGKALDNRLGVATLIELLKHCPEHIHLTAAFTVQEEIGARGAAAVAYNHKPDLAFILDSTPAMDQPSYDNAENTQYRTRLGFGPAIYAMDSNTLYDHRMVEFLKTTATENGIPYQIRQPGGGGTDAGAVHLSQDGIPTATISVPGRYAHTAVMIARKSDWENTLRLLTASLDSVSQDIFKNER
ncbi:MAG: M42 family metallopeptidase [Chloroflexi bacterium]|nr:M42 family metallopeptidase [Chloroflexota bacterium]